MRKQLLLLLIIIGFIVFRFIKQGEETYIEEKSKVEELITLANSYKGVAYRAGGVTKSGMDCSGLVTTVFKAFDKKLPRSSASMSKKGKEVSLSDVKKGDLLFFDISRLKGGINHVGLVVSVNNNDIQFIHSTSSKGVIVSSMKESYWKKEFVKAKRVF
ncbi:MULTISPECIES: C40 family peptidase [unclassified Tenacibaculum]|uniref:C40 family peptidase n=1 Tax=unclassified Tenacibaculum TaxID=2635139 RepID=UPI001F449435|nr:MULTISPECIES: C40 family peptidase [unclassified Tenacibaculum]MCF2875262.1 C40 family peptidase [Tenacibaculum sp. Cn5-1]MCF2935338.1 C40 family peptidase [Tenacibaculum sp. Cn5-34]MCG7511898.1 C40 family peptidase [Tenacibaculum sp. Cn5-46]